VNASEAFAPGSPAGGPSIAQGKKMTLPPLQFSSTAASRSGDMGQTMAFDSSGFSVNYGNGVSQGGSLPAVNPLVIGAVVLMGALWIKKST